MDSAWVLSNDTASNLTPNNPHFLYVWDIGLNDIEDALRRSIAYFEAEVDQYTTLNTVVESVKLFFFIVSLVLVNKIVFRPLVKRISVETKRAALMLAFLPSDINFKSLQQEHQRRCDEYMNINRKANLRRPSEGMLK